MQHARALARDLRKLANLYNMWDNGVQRVGQLVRPVEFVRRQMSQQLQYTYLSGQYFFTEDA
eukprot:6228008-Pyramimonas_sp.AAC.1